MDWFTRYENATELYTDSSRRWPARRSRPGGRWILASYDDDSIIVYQAYNPEIAKYACENNRFTGCPVYNEKRMTWIKTNFLWMMYRSKWATSSNQNNIIAIWLRRSAFDSYLAQAVHSQKQDESDDDEERSVSIKTHKGTVRLQWDPDHYPDGSPVLGRRAVQLGLRQIESFLDGQDIIRIVDITKFVHEQYKNAISPKNQLDKLRVPIENVYVPENRQTCSHIRIDPLEDRKD